MLRKDRIELRSEELHRRVAAEIRKNPRIIALTAGRIEHWMRRSDPRRAAALREWKLALQVLEPAQLADFLESPVPRARRMRMSSPFYWPLCTS